MVIDDVPDVVEQVDVIVITTVSSRHLTGVF
jgi:hypothetical protein